MGIAEKIAILDAARNAKVGATLAVIRAPAVTALETAVLVPQNNADFLAQVFGGLTGDASPFVTGFTGAPTNHSAWGGKVYQPGVTSVDGESLNRYFTLAVYSQEGGTFHRREKNCHAIYGVMLDDIGTKAKPRSHLDGCPPTLVIETSPANFQATYLFKTPQTDIQDVTELNRELVAAGLCDPGAKSPSTRWGRLPFAINGKHSPAFQCRLVEFHPERRYTTDQIRRGLKLDTPPRMPVAAEYRANDQDINKDITKPREDRHDRDLGLIAKRCGMVKAFLGGQRLEETEWHAMVGVFKFCTDGERLYHYHSAKDDRYDQAESQGKFDRWAVPPVKCGKFSHCATCDKPEYITTPVMFGDAEHNTPQKTKPNQDTVESVQAAMDASGLRTVMDSDGQLNFVSVAVVGGRAVQTCLPAGCEAATDMVIAMAYRSGGKPPSDRAIENFKATARHDARARNEAVPVYQRCAEIDGVLFVDLRPGWVARIDANGCRLVDDVADGVPIFRRGQGAGALPDPVLFDSYRDALKFALGVWVNVFGMTSADALILTANVLEFHRTSTPHPIIEVVGSAGSGKSSLSDFVVSLVDPKAGGDRVTVGTDSKDLAAAAQQRYVLTVDNAGRLDKETSDLLCTVSTGGTLLVRLYTPKIRSCP